MVEIQKELNEEQQNGLIYVRVNNLMDLNQMASMKTNETVHFAS